MTNQRNELPKKIELELPYWGADLILNVTAETKEEDGGDLVSIGVYVDEEDELTIVGLTDRGELTKIACGYRDQSAEDWTNYATSSSRINDILRVLKDA